MNPLSSHNIPPAAQSANNPHRKKAVVMPQGAWPVMLTPFTGEGAIDWDAYHQLIDWYLAAGVSGLFCVCLSSELYALSAEERIDLARHAVQRASGRVPVIGVGLAPQGSPLSTLADSVHRMAETGLDATVCLTNNFCAEDAPETEWCAQVEHFLQAVDPAIALGVYECPLPHARNISAAAVGWLAHTGRFALTKDTCCDLPVIRAKIQAAENTPLHFYNADARTLLASLNAGADGYSGIAANYFPHLFAWMCANYQSRPELAARLDSFFNASNQLVHAFYMQSAKVYLQRSGLSLHTRTRVAEHTFTAEHLARLDALQQEVKNWEDLLQIASPFAAVNAVAR